MLLHVGVKDALPEMLCVRVLLTVADERVLLLLMGKGSDKRGCAYCFTRGDPAPFGPRVCPYCGARRGAQQQQRRSALSFACIFYIDHGRDSEKRGQATTMPAHLSIRIVRESVQLNRCDCLCQEIIFKTTIGKYSALFTRDYMI